MSLLDSIQHYNSKNELFIKRSMDIYGTRYECVRYDRHKVRKSNGDVSIVSFVTMKCCEHGVIFERCASDYLRGAGCPRCI